MHKSKGFTLIELVVVIVILGILAVTAAPRFLNLQTDARNSALEGVAANIETAIETAHAKLVILGLEDKTLFTSPSAPNVSPEVAEWCSNCYFVNGYPGNMDATFETLISGVSIAAKGGQQEDIQIGAKGSSIAFGFDGSFNKSGVLTADSCYILYTLKPEGGYDLEVSQCE